MNIIVLGKGTLAIKACEWLKERHNISCIIPDMPEPEWTSSLKKWAIHNKTPYIDSGDYRDIDDSIQFDLAISIFYGKIIKKDFIDKCKNIINLHNAPLPKYRGVRPINWALKNDESYHGITIHKISEGIDDGDILGKLVYPIYPDVEEVEDVYNKSLEYGFLLFKDVMSKIDFCLSNATAQSDYDENPSYYSNKDIKLLGNREGFCR